MHQCFHVCRDVLERDAQSQAFRLGPNPPGERDTPCMPKDSGTVRACRTAASRDCHSLQLRATPPRIPRHGNAFQGIEAAQP
eukprot:9956826-Alexandrium_andersonii.AAC.1